MGYLAVILLLGSACAMGTSTYPIDAPARTASDVPGQFVMAPGAVGPDTASTPACHNPMIDPRDGTRIVLVSAQGGKVGDYRVPEGRYGVGPGELLRLNCGSGAVIGIIPGS
jgi:hypothetical protein